MVYTSDFYCQPPPPFQVLSSRTSYLKPSPTYPNYPPSKFSKASLHPCKPAQTPSAPCQGNNFHYGWLMILAENS